MPDGSLTLVIGGARSGMSAHAERLIGEVAPPFVVRHLETRALGLPDPKERVLKRARLALVANGVQRKQVFDARDKIFGGSDAFMLTEFVGRDLPADELRRLRSIIDERLEEDEDE